MVLLPAGRPRCADVEIEISRKPFSGKSSSYATGPRPNACHMTMEAVENTA